MKSKSTATRKVINALSNLPDKGFLTIDDIATILAKEEDWKIYDNGLKESIGKLFYNKYKARAKSLMERLMDTSDTCYKKEKEGKTVIYTLNQKGRSRQLLK